MKVAFEPARLTGFAILAAAGATALSVGACSSSHDESHDQKSPSASSSQAVSKGKDKDVIQGQVASVSGNAVQVSGTDESGGKATVDLGPSAKVIDYTKGRLPDVAAGDCVRVVAKSAPPPGGPAFALTVTLSPPADDGKCPQAKPAAAGSPDAPGSDKPFPVVGTVASVAGNTVKVADIDASGSPSQTEVTATDKTQYVKGVAATSQAVAQGKCITARGTIDKSGTLQATKVNLNAANAKGQCPTPKAK